MSERIYSSLLHRALEFAAIKHQGQFRRNPKEQVPYISHPACVGLMLARAGQDDEVVAAGILHDVTEDCGVTDAELVEKFSERVARLVNQVSEQDKSLAWEERKNAYRERLKTADVEAIAIAAADHIQNLRSLMTAYTQDPSVTQMFKTGMAEKMEHEKQCLGIFSDRLQSPLIREFEEAISESESLLNP